MAARLAVVSVVSAITADLRRRILSADLAPGTPLGEVDVADQYEVSRPTAKAAIEALVSAHLLERGAHKTARVVLLDADDVDDIYRTRELLESAAVRSLAAQCRVPEQARAANAEIAALADDHPTRIVEPDMRLHTTLVDALGSARTSRAYALLADEVRLCMSQVQGQGLLSTEVIAREHAALLDHIAAGRADEAVAQLRDHLTRARERLTARLADTSG